MIIGERRAAKLWHPTDQGESVGNRLHQPLRHSGSTMAFVREDMLVTIVWLCAQEQMNVGITGCCSL